MAAAAVGLLNDVPIFDDVPPHMHVFERSVNSVGAFAGLAPIAL
jgi:hypothetical protein